MIVNTKEIEDKILSALQSDPELSGYIQKFTVGEMDVSRKIFPFITLGPMQYRQGLLRAASGSLLCSIDIYAATNSLAPEVAYRGKEDTGKKGIVDICHDIRTVVENNTFNGAFLHAISDIRINPRYRVNTSETTIVGKVAFTGEVWFRY